MLTLKTAKEQMPAINIFRFIAECLGGVIFSGPPDIYYYTITIKGVYGPVYKLCLQNVNKQILAGVQFKYQGCPSYS